MTLEALSQYFWMIPWLILIAGGLALGGLYEAWRGGLRKKPLTMAEYKHLCFLHRDKRR